MNKVIKTLVISILGLSLVGCSSKLERSYDNALEFKDELFNAMMELTLVEEDLLGLSFERKNNIEEEITNIEELISDLDSSRCGSGNVILSADALKSIMLERVKVLKVKPLNANELDEVKRKMDKLNENYINDVSDFLESIEREIVIDKFV